MGRKHSASSIYPQLGLEDTAIGVSNKLKGKILVVHLCVCEFFINIVFLSKNLFILICKLRLIVIANGKIN